MGGDYRGGGTRPKKILLGGCKRNHPSIIVPCSKKKLFSILITVLVYCFPTFKFPNAYINLYMPLSPSDLVVTVIGLFPLPCLDNLSTCAIAANFVN